MNIKYTYQIIFLIFVIVALSANGCKINPDLSTTEVEQRVFQLVNKYRLSIQLGQLNWSDTIAQQCRSHSENMASGNTEVGHEGYTERFANIRASLANAVTFAENVAYISGHPDPADYALELWLEQQIHKENIEGNFNFTGVGAAKGQSGSFYITQIFARAK